MVFPPILLDNVATATSCSTQQKHAPSWLTYIDAQPALKWATFLVNTNLNAANTMLAQVATAPHGASTATMQRRIPLGTSQQTMHARLKRICNRSPQDSPRPPNQHHPQKRPQTTCKGNPAKHRQHPPRSSAMSLPHPQSMPPCQRPNKYDGPPPYH